MVEDEKFDELMEDTEALLGKVMDVLLTASEAALTPEPEHRLTSLSCTVSRRKLLDLKAEVERQYPGLYERMRGLGG